MSDYIKYEVRVYANGNKCWYLNDKLHREDGPAIEYVGGYKSWYLYGKRHREDGPAIESFNGYKYWYLNDQLHREDGPAIEYADGNKHWYLEGVNYTEFQHKAEIERRNNTCNGKVVTIEGKQYELTEIK
jgi:hypothetical protein